MKFILTVAFSALVALTGCDVAVIAAAENNDVQKIGATAFTMPAKMLLQVQGQPPVVYSGTLVGRISGRGDVALNGPDGTTCNGSFAADGKGTMLCGGETFEVDRGDGAKKSLSGAEYIVGQHAGHSYEVVFAWGRGANETTLQRVIQERRTLSAREVREMNPG